MLPHDASDSDHILDEIPPSTVFKLPGSNHDEMLPYDTSDSDHMLDETPSDAQPSASNSFSIARFIRKHKIKGENGRQSVVRRFKKQMIKIMGIPLPDPKDRRKFKAWETQIKRLYCIKKQPNSQFSHLFGLFVEMKKILSNTVDKAIFAPNYNKKKSCNNFYVMELFSSADIKRLYKMHHEMAMHGNMYFSKIKQFKKEGFDTEDDRRELFLYCESCLLYTSDAADE